MKYFNAKTQNVGAIALICLLLVLSNICNCQTCSQHARNTLIKGSVLSSDWLQTCHPVSDISTHISNFLDTCSYSHITSALTFAACDAACVADTLCYGASFADSHVCELCRESVASGDSATRPLDHIFVVKERLEQYILDDTNPCNAGPCEYEGTCVYNNCTMSCECMSYRTGPTCNGNGQLDVMLIVNNIDDMPAHVVSLVHFITDLVDGLGMSSDGVLVGASITNSGYWHQSSPTTLLNWMTGAFDTVNSLNVAFANARHHLTNSYGGVPRPGVAQVAIYISQGFTNDDAAYSRDSIEPVPDRYIVVGTHDANWNNLQQYNVDPDNRFTMDQLDTLLYALYALM